MDDFLTKKKETVPILDLSKSTATTKEEFKRLYEKVPDFKIKPEKVHPESIKMRDKKFKFKASKKDLKSIREPYAFQDPLPREMKNLKINDLANVPIDWKMLTIERPKNKTEENYFSRLVELRKSEIKTRAVEKRQFARDPQIRKTKNKAGVVEIRAVSCADCGEDFCDGKACNKLTYDCFTRVSETKKPIIPKPSPPPQASGKFRRDVKKKSKKTKKHHKKRSVSPKKK